MNINLIDFDGLSEINGKIFLFESIFLFLNLIFACKSITGIDSAIESRLFIISFYITCAATILPLFIC